MQSLIDLSTNAVVFKGNSPAELSRFRNEYIDKNPGHKLKVTGVPSLSYAQRQILHGRCPSEYFDSLYPAR